VQGKAIRTCISFRRDRWAKSCRTCARRPRLSAAARRAMVRPGRDQLTGRGSGRITTSMSSRSDSTVGVRAMSGNSFSAWPSKRSRSSRPRIMRWSNTCRAGDRGTTRYYGDDQQLQHVSILADVGARINSDEFWRGSGAAARPRAKHHRGALGVTCVRAAQRKFSINMRSLFFDGLMPEKMIVLSSGDTLRP
jgi:hypothetical protein